MKLLGLYTAIYRVPDVARAKAWYSAAFGVQPYFDEPFYVGFNIAGHELGLDPDPGGRAGPGGVTAYWGVPDLDAAVRHFTQVGGHPVGGDSGCRRRHSCRDDRRSVRQSHRPD